MIRIICVFLIFCGIITSSYGQGKAFYQKNFLEGKKAFEAAEYLSAYQSFSKITEPDRNNSFSNYASFYAMRSAAELKNWAQVERIGLARLKDAKRWKQIDEVRYLLVQAYHNKGSHDLALAMAKGIEDEGIRRHERALTSHFVYVLSKVELKELNQLVSEDELVARALVFKLAGSTEVEDQYLSHYLFQEYSFTDSLFAKPEPATKEHKEIYNVAVMLPFEFDKRSNGRTRFIEMAKGMVLAQDSLAVDGMKTALTFYDTKRDSAEVVSILSNLNNIDLDLIIGPIYPENTMLVDEYSRGRGIQAINPLQTKCVEDSLLSNTMFYKGQAKDLGRAMAQYAIDSLEAGDVLILTTNAPQDSILAVTYASELARTKKFKTHILYVTDENARSIQKRLHSIEYSGSISHVFSATKKKIVGSYLMTALEQEDIKKPAFAPFQWTKIATNTFEQYQRHNVAFYSSVTMDRDSVNISYSNFKNRFKADMSIRPITDHAAIGFDLMWGFRSLLESDGAYFYSHDDFSEVNTPVLGQLKYTKDGLGNNNIWLYRLNEQMKLEKIYSCQ